MSTLMEKNVSSQPMMGVCPRQAEYVFVLPNPPIMPTSKDEQQLGYVPALIALNGNHWRKIVTIIAKLTAPELDLWRQWRDEMLTNNVAIVFSTGHTDKLTGKVFFVGNEVRGQVPVPDEALVCGERRIAFVTNNRIWCPYLDYRQFPNVLVDELRQSIQNHRLESACFTC
ncbi:MULTISPECIES: DUF6942 family protein [Marinomonas]|uniref:DUF6942 family protein n=1 Tax=Marinomonas TaxID=28253 RepID=UPI0010565092|nr:hypothetical protein [Marinomonas sp. KMM3893]